MTQDTQSTYSTVSTFGTQTSKYSKKILNSTLAILASLLSSKCEFGDFVKHILYPRSWLYLVDGRGQPGHPFAKITHYSTKSRKREYSAIPLCAKLVPYFVFSVFSVPLFRRGVSELAEVSRSIGPQFCTRFIYVHVQSQRNPTFLSRAHGHNQSDSKTGRRNKSRRCFQNTDNRTNFFNDFSIFFENQILTFFRYFLHLLGKPNTAIGRRTLS